MREPALRRAKSDERGIMDNVKRFTCKTCGADLGELAAKAENGVVKCVYCDSVWTIVKKTTDKTAADFIAMGEHELDVCRFEEAYMAFRRASELDPKEPQAFWGMALAEFKVQYVKDEVNNHLQPICHEIITKNFLENANYLKALELATPEQKEAYVFKGKEIETIKKEFIRLNNSGTEYDCFICVKVTEIHTDKKTDDYERAREIYYYLKDKGYKPFFSELSLRGEMGADYEAHILYALNKSKCMLLICENEEYLRTPWVKNEYTRFLKMIADEEKAANAITFIFNGTPIERLPGRGGKLQGIDYADRNADEYIARYVEKLVASMSGDLSAPANAPDGDDKSDTGVDLEKLLKKAQVLSLRRKYDEAMEIYESLAEEYFDCIDVYIGILRVHSKNFTVYENEFIEADISVIENLDPDAARQDQTYVKYLENRKAYFAQKAAAQAPATPAPAPAPKKGGAATPSGDETPATPTKKRATPAPAPAPQVAEYGYSVRLNDHGEDKFPVIRVVRQEREDLDFATVKRMVEEGGILKEGLTKEQADEFCKKLTDLKADAVVEVSTGAPAPAATKRVVPTEEPTKKPAKVAQVEDTSGSYCVRMTSCGNDKFVVLRAVRVERDDLDFNTVKKLVENGGVIKDGLTKAQADKLCKKLKELGASVSVESGGASVGATSTPNSSNPTAKQIKEWSDLADSYNDKKNYSEAFKYFKMGAEQGNAHCQAFLGYYYSNGLGTDVDYSKAFSWYVKSAEQGNDMAQCNLGFAYEKGRGVTRDLVEAVKWYRKAAEQGSKTAQKNLGYCYEAGLGVSINYNEAKKWYLKAAEGGHSGAQYNLGDLYYSGRGVTQDYYEAVKWYRKSAEQGFSAAQNQMGECYYYGRGVSKDYAEAAKWYRKGAEQGRASAQFNLGYCYEKGQGLTQNYSEALRWYRKAVDQGNVSATNQLGECYYYGRGVTTDYNEAFRLYMKAAENGSASAQFNVGYCYEHGKGTATNKAKAREWYEKAAANGNANAKKALEEYRVLRR